MNIQKELNYYLLQDMKNNAFYMLHKFLFEPPFHSLLSNNAKILYTLIKDRMSLSIINKWYDSSGNVYCYFTNDDIKQFLNVSDKTATKNKNELLKIGLLEQQRQYDKATRYYLKKPKTTVENTQIRNKYDSVIVADTSPESYKVRTSNTELSNTELNNNNILHSFGNERKYINFADMLTTNITRWTNDIIKSDRSRITEDNFELCNSRLFESYNEFGQEDYIEFMNRYIKEKKQGRSVENFISYLERYERGL